MSLRQLSEDEEEARPDDYKEEDRKQGDTVERCVTRGPEVLPVSACGGGEEIVLEEDDDACEMLAFCHVTEKGGKEMGDGGDVQKPDNNLPAQHRLIE